MTDRRLPSIAFTRIALIVVVPIALLCGVRAVAWALNLKTFNSGDKLTAADLNANFSAINSSVVDVTSDQSIAGTKTFSGEVDVGLKIVQYDTGLTPLPAGCVTAFGYVECTCPAGFSILSGGGYCAGAYPMMTENRIIPAGVGCGPSGHTKECWRMKCLNTAGTTPGTVLGFNLACARIKVN